ncbi:hypothetical protein XENOCAPTIV_009233, partial [Xenoophorus captivus]
QSWEPHASRAQMEVILQYLPYALCRPLYFFCSALLRACSGGSNLHSSQNMRCTHRVMEWTVEDFDYDS